jgi:putative ABC transport system permease protein
LRMPVVFILGIKDAVARRGRAIMTILSVILCLVTIALSASIISLMDQYKNNPALRGITYDLVVTPTYLPAERTIEIIEGFAGTEGYYSETYRRAFVPARDARFLIKGIGGPRWQTAVSILRGRMVQTANEIILGRGALDLLGAEIGDRITVDIEGKLVTLSIVGEYKEMASFGQVGVVTLDGLRSLVPGADPNVIYLSVRPGLDVEEARKTLLQSAGQQMRVDGVQSGLPGFVADLPGMLQVLSLIMAAIAALSVLNTSLLSAREQMKEVGIRKAVGMTPTQIIGAVSAGGAWLGFAGTIFGAPLGILLNRFLVEMMSASVGVHVEGMNLPGLVLALLLVTGIGLAVVASLPAAMWANSIPVARVLQVE